MTSQLTSLALSLTLPSLSSNRSTKTGSHGFNGTLIEGSARIRSSSFRLSTFARALRPASASLTAVSHMVISSSFSLLLLAGAWFSYTLRPSHRMFSVAAEWTFSFGSPSFSTRLGSSWASARRRCGCEPVEGIKGKNVGRKDESVDIKSRCEDARRKGATIVVMASMVRSGSSSTLSNFKPHSCIKLTFLSTSATSVYISARSLPHLHCGLS